MAGRPAGCFHIRIVRLFLVSTHHVFKCVPAGRVCKCWRRRHRSAKPPCLCCFVCRGPLRWHISYNLAVLRMLSYGMDLRWARRATAGSGPVPSAMSGTTANSKLGDGSSQQTAGEADSSDSLKVCALGKHLRQSLR